MGMLLDGVWHDVPRDTKSTGGAFVRPESAFRASVSADGHSGFKAEAGRYHLYIARACPWAHRTAILRAMKGLDAALPMSIVDSYFGPHGWEFTGENGATRDAANDCRYLYQVYLLAKPDYSGRVTVPVLWDTRRRTIVNNESSELLRMLNSEFDALATRNVPDLYPGELRAEIDTLNARVYRDVNNGVYRAGFATAQDKYEEAVTQLFAALDWLEERLAARRWLCGERLTEADLRLFTTLVRFDAVYYSHFKCNIRRLIDFPNLWRHTCEAYALPGVAQTVDIDAIKAHYYCSMPTLNPTRIVPKGPILDFTVPRRGA